MNTITIKLKAAIIVNIQIFTIKKHATTVMQIKNKSKDIINPNQNGRFSNKTCLHGLFKPCNLSFNIA